MDGAAETRPVAHVLGRVRIPDTNASCVVATNHAARPDDAQHSAKPSTRYARGAMRLPLKAEILGARAVGALSRLARTGGGTTIAGKLLLWKLDPGRDRPACRKARAPGRCSSPPRTGRRRRPRWSRRSSAPTRGSRTTARARIWSRASPPRSSTRTGPSSGSSRWTKPRFPKLPGGCGLARCACSTSSATSSTATASSSCVAERWRAAVRALDPHASVIVNGDDPQLGGLASDREEAVVFGVDDPRCGRADLQHAADSKYCIRCGTPYHVFAAAYVGHLGDYRCPRCGHARPPLDVVARDIELSWARERRLRPRDPPGDASRPPAPPRPLQRLQRARGRGADPDDGDRAGADPGGPGAVQPRLRPLRANRAGRPLTSSSC